MSISRTQTQTFLQYSVCERDHSSIYRFMFYHSRCWKKQLVRCYYEAFSSATFLASNEVCQTCLNPVDKFCSKCKQSQCFIMLFVVHPSGVSRATSSCSPRPFARSLSSQTSSPSQITLMSCMKTPKISLMDRCVDRAVFWFGFYFFTALSHLFNPFRFLPVWTSFTSYDLPVKIKAVDIPDTLWFSTAEGLTVQYLMSWRQEDDLIK